MFKLVYIGPSDFKVLVYRLITIGAIVLIGFNFGSWFYLFTVSNLDQKVKLKNLADILSNSVKQDRRLEIDGKTIVVKSEELKTWIETYKRFYSGEEDLRSSKKLDDYLISLATTINIEPVDARFEFENNSAKIFNQSVQGKRLDIEKSKKTIMNSLAENKIAIQLEVETVDPQITLEKVNNLGIETLLAKGESNFIGSHAARTHNIKVGATKFNGTIVKPGEQFSFNDILGKVDDKTGYQYELVIKNGQTIPEYGGGLCQVSTTVFRAAILAGLPIIERRPHSFPVKYYNPQGFDATIYPGVSDLKFINDTGKHILIQTKIENSKLSVEIYGTDDGRRVVLDGPHQYDQRASGAMKAYFVRTISEANGEKKEERFDSNYQPPFPMAKNPLE